MSLTDQAPRVLLAMAYKLIVSAQIRWRAVNVPHLIALVRAGSVFDKGQTPGTADRHHADTIDPPPQQTPTRSRRKLPIDRS